MLGEMKQAYDPMYIYFELGKITRYFDPVSLESTSWLRV